MRQFITFLRKEFAHVLRDRKTLLILFGLPIVQILIFGFALTNEVKNSRIVVVDNARDNSSRKLIDKIESSHYFEIETTAISSREIENSFRKGVIRLAIIIPVNFENDLAHTNHAALQVIADASDPNTATTLTNYITAIVQDYQNEINSSPSNPYMIRNDMRMLYLRAYTTLCLVLWPWSSCWYA
jgi:ABC-2 type transport system permease protein